MDQRCLAKGKPMNRLIVVAGFCLAATMTMAQERLTLDGAVGIALERNQLLRGSAYERDAAQWGKLHAVTNFLPKVELSAGVTRIDDRSVQRANAAIDFIQAAAGAIGIPPSALSEIKPFAYLQTYTADVLVVQPIYNGGAEIVGLDVANAEQDKSEFAYQEMQQDVIARVKTTYYNVIKAEALVGLAKDAVGRTTRHLETTRRRAEAGQRTHTDELRWEVQLASDEGNLVNAENGLAASFLQLNEVMGVDLHARYMLENPVPADSVIPPAPTWLALNALTGTVPGSDTPVISAELLANHPSMQVMESNLRLADAGVSQSWVNFKPRINFAFQYGWEKNNTIALDGITPWAVALQVNYPIFSSFADYTNVQKAKAEFSKTELQVEKFRRLLQLQATTAELGLLSARKRMDIARKAQDEAREVLASLTRRYEAGGASNVELIDVQTAYTSARADYITAVYDYYIADLQLARATGMVKQ
jgi:outer membrane protein